MSNDWSSLRGGGAVSGPKTQSPFTSHKKQMTIQIDDKNIQCTWDKKNKTINVNNEFKIHLSKDANDLFKTNENKPDDFKELLKQTVYQKYKIYNKYTQNLSNNEKDNTKFNITDNKFIVLEPKNGVLSPLLRLFGGKFGLGYNKKEVTLSSLTLPPR